VLPGRRAGHTNLRTFALVPSRLNSAASELPPQPHSFMLAAIAATWASVCVRAFLAYGISRSITQRSTLSAGHGL